MTRGLFSLLCLFSFGTVSAADSALRQVGVAKVDITPDYPVRLTGYAVRKTEPTGAAQHLYARALALGSDKDKPAILITVDNCGVPNSVRDQVATRLRASRRIESERLAICSTHTHCGPWVKGFAPNIFGAPVPPDQETRVERY